MQASANIDSKSAKASLTRRAALGGLAVLAVPTAAAAVSVAPGSEGPDPVIQLCKAFREIEDGFHERMERAMGILDRVNAAMPLPDPLIVQGPHTEALSLDVPAYEGRWQPPHNAIEPRHIESRLAYIKPIHVRVTESVQPDGKVAKTFVLLDEPEPLTPEQQELHDKLSHMLQLSKEYYAEHGRRLTAAGYDDGDDIVDDIAERQCVIERAIRIRPAQTREGILAKIDLYLSEPERFMPTRAGDSLATSIMRDVRRLLSEARS